MPVDIPVAFLAVDEIQLCTDSERGHVFTDRLMHARGEEETMWLGALTMKSAIARIAPGDPLHHQAAVFRLAYTGAKKLSRLPRRSAIVVFSVEDVYSIADTVRSQRGGAAVVLGALSPAPAMRKVDSTSPARSIS
jgi:ATP-dependent RNA helicase SUPV3L1/SUV3